MSKETKEIHSDDQAMSEAQAALFLGYGRETLKRWRMLNFGPKFIKISRTSIRYRIKDLKEWLELRVVTPGRDPKRKKNA